MPYGIIDAGKGMYSVVNTASGKVHAYRTTLENAMAQLRLLRGVEHGMVPRGRMPTRSERRGQRERTSSGTPIPRK